MNPLRRVGSRRLAPLATLISLIALIALAVLASMTPPTTAGYVASVTNSTDTTATASYFSCTAAEAADASTAYFQYYLNEGSNSLIAVDSSTNLNPGAYRGTMTTTTGAGLACSRDIGGAYTLNGTTSYVSTTKLIANPQTFSVEAWFKTSTAAGKIIGFGNALTGSSGQYDRHLYIETTGKLDFGTYNGGIQVLTTPTVVTDGKWHHVVGTMSAATGMRLYLDGAMVASSTAYTTAENYSGYWRVGYDNTGGWQNNGANYFFAGQLRYAAAYSSVLTATQVKNHWAAGQ